MDGDEYYEEAHQPFCRGEELNGMTFSNNVQDMIGSGIFTKEELIENNVVGSDSVFVDIKIGDKTSCINYTEDFWINEWWGSQEVLETMCSGENIIESTGMDVIEGLIEEGRTSDYVLVSNNVLEGSVETEKQCATDAECFTYEDYTFIKDFDLNQEACTTYFTEKYGEWASDICTDATVEEIKEIIFEDDIHISELVDAGAISNIEYEEGFTITGYDTKCGLNVKIPNSINNTPVIAIKDYSFRELDEGIKELYLPNSITYVGVQAFANYPATLKYIHLENQSA